MFSRGKVKLNRSFRVFRNIIALCILIPVMLMCVVGIVGISLEFGGNNIYDLTDIFQGYIEEVDRPEVDIPEYNGDGTVNGLNLLLIQEMAEGYAKEYLAISAKSESKELNSFERPATVEQILAATMNEKGYYRGTLLPRSYLPTDSNGEIIWNKPYAGLPANAMTLSEMNRNVISQPAIGGIGPMKTNSRADDVGSPGSDYSVTPFQINLYGPKTTFSPEWKSNMDGYNDKGRTTSDILYFPDQITAIGTKTNSIGNYINTEGVKPEVINLMFSATYNPGVGNFQKNEMAGTKYKSQEMLEILEFYYEELKYVYDKAGYEIFKKGNFQTGQYHARVYSILVEDRGWKFGNVFHTEFSGIADRAHMGGVWDEMPGRGNINTFIRDNTESFGCFTSSGQVASSTRTTAPLRVKLPNGKYLTTDGIAVGHAFTKVFFGPLQYAIMLKSAGLDVDPTNPSDYMNTQVKPGEWIPSGNTDWMKEAAVDMSKMNEKRFKYLNEGYSIHHSPYSMDTTLRHQWPVKKNGVWSGATDCSSFTKYCVLRNGGPDIGASTYYQTKNENLIEIPFSEAKPGDVFIGWGKPGVGSGHGANAHTGFYLSGDAGGVLTTLHSGYDYNIPGKHRVFRVNVATTNFKKVFINYKMYRIKGIDD